MDWVLLTRTQWHMTFSMKQRKSANLLRIREELIRWSCVELIAVLHIVGGWFLYEEAAVFCQVRPLGGPNRHELGTCLLKIVVKCQWLPNKTTTKVIVQYYHLNGLSLWTMSSCITSHQFVDFLKALDCTIRFSPNHLWSTRSSAYILIKPS